MNTYHPFSRRRFLKSVVVSIAASTTLSACSEQDYLALAQTLTLQLTRRDLALKVGKAYDKYIEAQTRLDIPKIVESLLSTLDLNASQLKALSPEGLHNKINAQVKQEFESETVFKVVGWLLSETETRLCLLAYLLDTPAKAA
ncbi:MAG: hypothetical protein V3V09_00905 [Arenicellales bacterium]